MNIDKLIDINLALENYEMPLIEGGRYDGKTFHESKWNGNKMPKNLADHETKLNEKFLDNYLCIIEDTLTPKQLDQFVDYQNWNFQHGLGELTERAGKNYVDSAEHWKEGLFNSCECKEKRQIEKLVRESLLGINNFGVFPNKWTNLIPQHTNFSYQALVTFSNASVNRAACEDATVESGGYSTTSYNHGGSWISWTGFGSGITNGVSANTNYNELASRWMYTEGRSITGAMYDSDEALVGDGLQTIACSTIASGVYWTVGSGLGEFCTGDATLRAGVGHAGGGGISGQCTDNTGAVSYKDAGFSGGAMTSYQSGTGEMNKAIGWKFSFV